MQAAATKHRSQTQSSHSRNDDFIAQIIDGSRSVLRVVVDLMGPTKCLTYISVRSYYRILAAVVYLIKVCRLPRTLFTPALSGDSLAFPASLTTDLGYPIDRLYHGSRSLLCYDQEHWHCIDSINCGRCKFRRSLGKNVRRFSRSGNPSACSTQGQHQRKPSGTVPCTTGHRPWDLPIC